MEEINQNSQTSLDFNSEKFEPKNEIEIQQIIKFCYKKNLPIEIVGNKTKITATDKSKGPCIYASTAIIEIKINPSESNFKKACNTLTY